MVAEIGLGLILPANTTTTCNLGRGGLIDYDLCRRGVAPTAKLEAAAGGPWKTHVGLALSVKSGKHIDRIA